MISCACLEFFLNVALDWVEDDAVSTLGALRALHLQEGFQAKSLPSLVKALQVAGLKKRDAAKWTRQLKVLGQKCWLDLVMGI